MAKEKTSPINALLDYELALKLTKEAQIRVTTKTQIITDALNLYFQKFNNLEFVDSITEQVIEDKSSIMIPKDLYMKLFGMTEKELETFIQKSKIKTALLNINNEEKISYLKLNLDDKKSIFKILIKDNQEIENLRRNTIENNQKISMLEKNLEKIFEKIKENKTE
jgi:hypothetical protein